jgi:hypothetical protein
MDDLRRNEDKIVKKVYDETAALNRVRSLRAYEARAHRFARIADDLSDDAAASKRRTRAAAIRADAASLMSRASLIVVRRRAGRVVRSWSSLFAFLAFAGDDG